MKKYKYHYVYKIINDFDNRYYVGKHSTNNIDDDYFGSGLIIKKLINKYGKEHFHKIILKTFETSLDAYKYEEKIVNETLLSDTNCINLRKGGLGWNYENDDFSHKMSLAKRNTVVVKDSNNNYFRVNCNDERIKTGELIYANKGIKRSNETKQKLKEIHIQLGKNPTEKMKNAWKNNAKNRKGKKLNISEEGRLKHLEANKKPKQQKTKDKLSNKIHVCKLINDMQLHEFIDKDKLNSYLDDGWKLGMYAIKRVYIHKFENNAIITKRICENELQDYLDKNWIKGRGVCTFNITENGKLKENERIKRCNRTHIYKIDEYNNIIRKLIKNEFLDEYLNKGWIKGKK